MSFQTMPSRRTFLRTTLGALLAPGLMACAPSVVEPVVGARLTARPGSPTRTPTKGVVTPLGIDTFRDGYLYVPTSYSPDTPMPLFVALHGAGGDGQSWASYPDRAEAHGMIVLAPDSRSSTWDLVYGGFGPDVQFLNQALRLTFQR